MFVNEVEVGTGEWKLETPLAGEAFFSDSVAPRATFLTNGRLVSREQQGDEPSIFESHPFSNLQEIKWLAKAHFAERPTSEKERRERESEKGVGRDSLVSRSEGSYSGLIDILLGHLHKLIVELRMKETISGHLVRQDSTAVCILDKMIFGLSYQAIISINRMFRSGLQHETNGVNGNDIGKFCGQGVALLEDCVQKMYQNSGARTRLIDYIASPQQSGEDGDISFHAFNDNAVLHQVIIEGIARRAAVLHVGHLVLENSDYVIDSVCRQLCHLDVNPRVPNVLATMLSYVGEADKIFSLLEEPMRAISMELEILGWHRQSPPNFNSPLFEAAEKPKPPNTRLVSFQMKQSCTRRISNAINALGEENMDSGALHNGQDLPNGLKVI
ncbi:hypothetical protein ACS0TY_016271 [Phlomoides rotata]